MLTRRASLVALAGAVAFFAGCGGGYDQASLVATSKCLVSIDGATADFGTPLHEAMSGGALRVVLPENEVQVGFGKDGDEAREVGGDVQEGLSGTVAARNYRPDELVSLTKNVVLAWKAPPSAEERAAVERCLS